MNGAALLTWFEVHGRARLPWRIERTPYRVTVSEFMLQQTQVERVLPAFERFVARFASFEALAAASQADVVRAWRGLGYNSRALRLHKLAVAVCERYGGILPDDETVLRTLPGIGSYTARAIIAFAFDRDVVAFDTNVRRIAHRVFFGLENPARASERELVALTLAAIPQGRGFAFNSALMDLGATICGARAARCLVCPLQRDCAAAPVDPSSLAALARAPRARERFEATARFIRGKIVDRLRALPAGEAISMLALDTELAPLLEHQRNGAVAAAVAGLERDGLVARAGDQVTLA